MRPIVTDQVACTVGRSVTIVSSAKTWRSAIDSFIAAREIGDHSAMVIIITTTLRQLHQMDHRLLFISEFHHISQASCSLKSRDFTLEKLIPMKIILDLSLY